MYYVLKRMCCDICYGSGIIQHPEWTAFWRARAYDTDMPMEEDLASWFGDKLPPEKIECSECDGKGFVEFQVTLESALKDLGIRP